MQEQCSLTFVSSTNEEFWVIAVLYPILYDFLNQNDILLQMLDFYFVSKKNCRTFSQVKRYFCLFFAPRGHNNCFYQYKYMIKLWSHKYITNAVYRQSERAPKNQCSHNGGKIWENINSVLQQAMLQLWCQSLPGRYHCLLYGQGERKKTKHEILHFYHRRYLWLFHSH